MKREAAPKMKKTLSSKKIAQKNEHAEKTLAVEEKESTSEQENEKGTSMEQLKVFLDSIIEMDESALKALCREKSILPKGRSTMKHKYAFALFRDALLKL